MHCHVREGDSISPSRRRAIASTPVSDELVLEMRGIRKEFPGVVANDDVSFDVRRGEVHALLGENGAGKSTLMNILYGLYQPDAGEIRVNGKPVTFALGERRDRGRHRHGAPALHAHPGDDRRRERRARDGAASKTASCSTSRPRSARVADMAKTFNFAVDPGALVEDIGVGQQQRVEIMKALYRNADILILDEPTAVLTPQEALDLFEILRTLRREGISIIFITHKLDEVLEIADRITVLRRGKTIETVPREGATEQSLARAMVGRDVLLRVEKPPAQVGDVLLEVEDLWVSDDRGIEKVRGVSFEVRAGEIVGIAGVDGNGQTELIDALTGLRRARCAASSASAAASSTTRRRASALDAGLGHIPEDRQRRGLVLEFSLAENIALHDYAKPPDSKWGWLFPGRLGRARESADQGVRRARRRPVHAGRCAVGRQPAEGRGRARDLPRPEGADRGAAHARPRRRRDRVPPSAARHGARRGPRDPARVARARGDLLALRPDPRALRRRDRRRARRAPSRRSRSASRWSASDAEVPPRDRADTAIRLQPPEHAAEAGTLAARLSLSQRAGGIAVPVATVLLAFLIGGLVVLATRPQPASSPTTTSSTGPG